MHRLLFGVTVAAIWLAGITCNSAFADKPNIIVILADDMGYADLSCYGNDRYQTPHLDQLAREGLKFTDFHSNGTVCSPTRAAFMTGRYQQRCGIDEVITADPKAGKRDRLGMPDAETTLPELLKSAGYATGITGKWHLGYTGQFNPTRHGFDMFRGYVSGNVDFHSHIDQANFEDWWHDQQLHPETGYSTHLITQHAVRFIEQNVDQPFFLYVAHEAPHYPYQGPGDPPVRGRPEAMPPHSDGAEIQRAYREMVQEMDTGVGQIMATLKRTGLDDKTLVFFFSDNGGTAQANNGGLHGFKGSVWEGGHRVPAIARWPGQIAASTSTDVTAIGMDLLPTLLDLSSTPVPQGLKLDGISLRSVLLDQKSVPERTLFWGFGGRYAVRQGDWKLIVNSNANTKNRKAAVEPALALFDLSSDLAEKADVASQQSSVAHDLQVKLAEWQKDVADSR